MKDIHSTVDRAALNPIGLYRDCIENTCPDSVYRR